VEHGAKPCPRQEGCPISPVWQDFYELILKHLSGISLKDILDNSRASAASRPPR
jgi:DNA-binding IscR family transcriptional regulator